MQIGGSLFLFAIGAILAFAVTTSVAGISLQMVGYILMAVGAVGLLLTIIMNSQNNEARVQAREQRAADQAAADQAAADRAANRNNL